LKGPFGFGDKELHQLGTAAAAAAFAGDLQFFKVKKTHIFLQIVGGSYYQLSNN
jgi:hypothetical protein